MSLRTSFVRPRTAKRYLPLLTVAMLQWLPTPAPADAYLEAIQREAQKLDAAARPLPASPPTAAPPGGDATDAAPGGQDALARFEKELDERYHDSYVFYKKLPPRNREEVFREYSRGVAFEEVRRMIMDRYIRAK